jgi:GNAT superfamily N-acetyltransferase
VHEVDFRQATAADLPAIIALLTREDEVVDPAGVEVDESYQRGFEAVQRDTRNEMLVLDDGGEIVAYLQVTYIPGLGRRGAERALIEGVRVRTDRRGSGLGRDLFARAIERARVRGCTLIQLSSNKHRTDAHRFYRSLGFEATHEGFKLPL